MKNMNTTQQGPSIDFSDTRALAEKRAQQLSKEPELNLREATNRPDAPASWAMKSLPPGTVRHEHKFYEAVYVPAPPKPVPPPGENLVVVDEAFDDFAKLAFQGIKTLNRIQSRVFETAYKSNENMLICAPTGAGKTNVALMTMLHEIGQHFSPSGVLRRGAFPCFLAYFGLDAGDADLCSG
jgi:activating signal cointegrator complex subunit 3